MLSQLSDGDVGCGGSLRLGTGNLSVLFPAQHSPNQIFIYIIVCAISSCLAGREVQWVKKTWPILSFINPCLSFPLCKNEDNKVLPKHSHPILKKTRERKIRWQKTHKKADLSLNMSIITLNVNRPNALVKRQRWGDQIKKQNPVLCCLQEAQE